MIKIVVNVKKKEINNRMAMVILSIRSQSSKGIKHDIQTNRSCTVLRSLSCFLSWVLTSKCLLQTCVQYLT